VRRLGSVAGVRGEKCLQGSGVEAWSRETTWKT